MEMGPPRQPQREQLPHPDLRSPCSPSGRGDLWLSGGWTCSSGQGWCPGASAGRQEVGMRGPASPQLRGSLHARVTEVLPLQLPATASTHGGCGEFILLPCPSSCPFKPLRAASCQGQLKGGEYVAASASSRASNLVPQIPNLAGELEPLQQHQSSQTRGEKGTHRQGMDSPHEEFAAERKRRSQRSSPHEMHPTSLPKVPAHTPDQHQPHQETP